MATIINGVATAQEIQAWKLHGYGLSLKNPEHRGAEGRFYHPGTGWCGSDDDCGPAA